MSEDDLIDLVFERKDDYYDMLDETNLYQYRTTDGSLLIAEEIEFDPEFGCFYTGPIFEICADDEDGEVYIQPYMNYSPDDDAEDIEGLSELYRNGVIARVYAPLQVRRLYLHYLMARIVSQQAQTAIKNAPAETAELSSNSEDINTSDKPLSKHEMFEEYYNNVWLRNKKDRKD